MGYATKDFARRWKISFHVQGVLLYQSQVPSYLEVVFASTAETPQGLSLRQPVSCFILISPYEQDHLPVRCK
jgi:hypothetical protein